MPVGSRCSGANKVQCRIAACSDRLAGHDYRREGYGLLNARLGIEEATWSIIVGVTNVLDKDAELAFPDSAAANLPGYTRVVPVRPRTFGVTFEQRS